MPNKRAKGKKRYTMTLTESKMELLKEAAAKSDGFTLYSVIFEAALDELIEKQLKKRSDLCV